MVDRLLFSIDLEAELRKIAQRQHLNDVNYLVQLVRHALRHDPGVIRIVSTRRCLTICQDGRPFPDSELELLQTIIGGDDLLRQQAALGALEREHGITILSVLLSFSRVAVTSAMWTMTAAEGHLRVHPIAEAIPGYRIVIHRRLRGRDAERKELDFFCAGCVVPIHYNSVRINRPITLRGQVLSASAGGEAGRGELGIPLKATLSAMSYFKAGVRFGFRRFLDPRGMTVEGYWDSAHHGFEPHYEQSTRAGEAFLHAARITLFDEAAARFAALEIGQKQRVRPLGLLLLAHRPQWRHAPLFDSVRQPFSLAMTHLEDLKERFGAIPCSLRFSPRLPRWVPRLALEEIKALRDMGHAITLLSITPPRLRWRGLAARLNRLVGAEEERLSGSS